MSWFDAETMVHTRNPSYIHSARLSVNVTGALGVQRGFPLLIGAAILRKPAKLSRRRRVHRPL